LRIAEIGLDFRVDIATGAVINFSWT